MAHAIQGRLQCGMPGTVVVTEPVSARHVHAAHIAVVGSALGALHHHTATHKHSHQPQMDWNVWGVRVGLLGDI